MGVYIQELAQIRASFALLSEKSKVEHDQFEKTSANLVVANQVSYINHIIIIITLSSCYFANYWYTYSYLAI